MNINENRTALLKRYLIKDYKGGNKKAIYNIEALFREFKFPIDSKFKRDILKPIEESGFISIIKMEYFRITIKGIKEINGRDTHKKTDFSK